jgi:hypothetical protein
MRILSVTKALLAAGLVFAPCLSAQDSAAAKPAKVSSFWQSLPPFEMTLTVNLKKVRGDRMEDAPWEPATVSFTDSGKTITIPARVKTRGNSRLKVCTLFPPLWVDFSKGADKKLAFDHLNRFKLVTPCKPPSVYERYAIEEYNLYRLHELMTPVSHLTRMIKLTVVDSASKKAEFTRYSFAVEDADELAARLGGKKFAIAGATAADLDQYQTAVIGVLQYMIGNTDFSIYALHNAELVQLKTGVYPVAYDFDQAGAINTSYATPDPKLGIRSVTDRLYRGLCVPSDTVTKILGQLKEKRPAIMALYADTIGKLIEKGGVRESERWFDEFYKDMSNPRIVKGDVLEKCRDVR